jgi:hypothetical protein
MAAKPSSKGDPPFDPPIELEMGFQCLNFHTLPEAGGLRDQLAGDVERMSAALSTYNAVGAWYTAMNSHTNMGQWQNRNRSMWKTVQAWIELEDARREGEWQPNDHTV